MHFKMCVWRFGFCLNAVARCKSNNNNEKWPLSKSLAVDYVWISLFWWNQMLKINSYVNFFSCICCKNTYTRSTSTTFIRTIVFVCEEYAICILKVAAINIPVRNILPISITCAFLYRRPLYDGWYNIFCVIFVLKVRIVLETKLCCRGLDKTFS